MHVLEHLDALRQAAYPAPVLALGNFDGVHCGHQAILRHATAQAAALGGTSMVFTFDPHPSQILAPEKPPLLLTTFTEKMRLLAELGIDVCLRIPFTQAFARQQPQDFIRDVLSRQIGVRALVVGYDFRFGHRRAGTVALLQEQATTYGYTVTVVPAITHEGIVVSSSNVRRLLLEGDVDVAARLLGRFYTIEGEVVAGFRRGTSIGFPTANVRSANAVMPHTGVYAVRVAWAEQSYVGVANIGYNPTFNNETLSTEVHLFDFSADLYGETIRVAFVKKIRNERKFASVDELIAQITCDAEQARAIHAHLTSPA